MSQQSKDKLRHNLRIILLGTGSSGGVPRVGGDWGACDPREPKNTRTRCSLAIEYWQGEATPPESERTIAIIDTSPDLRAQFLSAKIDHVDALFYTHDHADQMHGIDDIRAIAYRYGKRPPTYANAFTYEVLRERFGYCFEQPEGRMHPPILQMMPPISGGQIIEVEGPGGVLPVKAVSVSHGNYEVLGFSLFDKIAYMPDVHDIAPEVMESLYGLDVWIVDALRYHPHPTHAHVDRTLSWAAQTRTREIILTDLHIDMDYATLCKELPGPHRVGYDNMVLDYVL